MNARRAEPAVVRHFAKKESPPKRAYCARAWVRGVWGQAALACIHKLDQSRWFHRFQTKADITR